MKDAELRPSQVPISAVGDQTLAPVLTLAAAPIVAAVARTCAPVQHVAAARSAAPVLTLVAAHTYAQEDRNEEFRFAPAVAASPSLPDLSHRCYRPSV